MEGVVNLNEESLVISEDELVIDGARVAEELDSVRVLVEDESIRVA
jgi:hypothetical protein